MNSEFADLKCIFLNSFPWVTHTYYDFYILYLKMLHLEHTIWANENDLSALILVEKFLCLIHLFILFTFVLFNSYIWKTCEIQSFYLEGQSNMHFQLGLAWISRQQSYLAWKKAEKLSKDGRAETSSGFFFF